MPWTQKASLLVLLVGLQVAPVLAQEKKLREPDVIFVPTPQNVVSAMLKLANVQKGDIVYDLGCGDGRLVVTAVKEYGARRAVGIDINPERIKESQETARKPASPTGSPSATKTFSKRISRKRRW